MITFEQVVEMIRKENEYATRWGKGTRKISHPSHQSDLVAGPLPHDLW